jgi:hypothetical protein
LERLVSRLQTQQNAPREMPAPSAAPAYAAQAEAVPAASNNTTPMPAHPVYAAMETPATPVLPMVAAPSLAASVAAPVVGEERRSHRTVRTFGFDLKTANEIVSRRTGKTLEQLTQQFAEPAKRVAEAPGAESETETAPVFQFDFEPKRKMLRMPVVAASVAAAPATGSISDVQIPGGFFDAAALESLVSRHGVFQGLVVVVNVATRGELKQESRPHYERLMSSVTRTIRSLGRDQDFTARSAEDEFVLIFPRETGTLAQRRMQQVSERLWDFQLRALGAYSVLFSWGAEESANETLASLIESAREQIREAKAEQPEAPLAAVTAQ